MHVIHLAAQPTAWRWAAHDAEPTVAFAAPVGAGSSDHAVGAYAVGAQAGGAQAGEAEGREEADCEEGHEEEGTRAPEGYEEARGEEDDAPQGRPQDREEADREEALCSSEAGEASQGYDEASDQEARDEEARHQEARRGSEAGKAREGYEEASLALTCTRSHGPAGHPAGPFACQERPASASSDWTISPWPNAPSSRPTIVPAPSIVKSQGSLGRFHAATVGARVAPRFDV